MTAFRDRNRMIQAFLREGDEVLEDQVYDAVRSTIEQTRQRTLIGPWRTPIMSKLVPIGLGAAAATVLLVVGIQLLGSPNDDIGSQAMPSPDPSPSAPTVASGSFAADVGEWGRAFEIDAIGTVDDVSGTLEVSNPSGSEGAYSVNLQCARSVDDGPLVVGGEVSESTYDFVSDGAYVAIAFNPGTPVRTVLAIDVVSTDEVPAPAESCSAFLETLLSDPEFLTAPDAWIPIRGDLQLGQ